MPENRPNQPASNEQALSAAELHVRGSPGTVVDSAVLRTATMPNQTSISSASQRPELAQRTAILQQAAQSAVAYLEALDRRSVAPSAEAVSAMRALRTSLPESETAPAEVIRLLGEFGGPATMAISGGRFFGFVIGGCLPAAMAASWLVDTWDQNAGLWTATPVAAELEETAVEWARELLGLPEGIAGGVVTGATVANYTALAAARHFLLERAGWDVEADGLFGAPELRVVVGEEAHPSLLKSLSMLGLGKKRVVRVPVDRQGRMRADALPHLDAMTILCLQAGNVNTRLVRSRKRNLRRGTRCGCVDPRGRRVRPLGRCVAPIPAPCEGFRAGRFMGNRRAQMAEPRLRLRIGLGAERGSPACSNGHASSLSWARWTARTL